MPYWLLSFLGSSRGAWTMLTLVVGLLGTAIYANRAGKNADYWENKAAIYEQNIETRDKVISSLSGNLVALNKIAEDRELRAKELAEAYAQEMEQYEELRKANPDVDDWWTTPIPDGVQDIGKNRGRGD